MDEVTRHILEKLNHPGLFEALAQRLTAAELNTLLLEVFNQRLTAQPAPALLNKYIGNRLVKPAAVNVIRLREEELQTCRLLAEAGFEPVELSPVTQLGASAGVAPVNQKKVLSALRGTEVLSDPTNAIALHYAHLKKSGRAGSGLHQFCSIGRMLRTSFHANPAYTPHFTVAALVTAGATTADAAFEKHALHEHVTAHERVCREVYGIGPLHLEVIPHQGHTATHPFLTACLEGLPASMPVTFRAPETGKGYYYGFQVKVMAYISGVAQEVGDCGPVNWTQQLLQDKKERMFISGLGAQLLHHFRATK